MTRILLGCFEVPGWGGLTTATYRLFETMLTSGRDVHYVNLIVDSERPRFENLFGARFENPRGLHNVHSCYLTSQLHESHPGLSDLIDEIDPDRMVGVGSIAAYLLKRASPQRESVFLTTGCMQVDRCVPFTEQWRNMQAMARPATPDWKERKAVASSDLVLTHSPMIRDLYLRLYPEDEARIDRSVYWFAEWIIQDAQEYSRFALPFDERNIDALFVASSWTRPEKNVQLLSEISQRTRDLSIHVVGAFDQPIDGVTHHGFVAAREELFRLMGRSRSVVSPSYFDAAPGILFEASAMGCNVVTSRNCGNWEICNDQLLITEYSAEAFAEAIRRARHEKLPDGLALFTAESSYQSLDRVLTDTSLSIPSVVGDPAAP